MTSTCPSCHALHQDPSSGPCLRCRAGLPRVTWGGTFSAVGRVERGALAQTRVTGIEAVARGLTLEASDEDRRRPVIPSPAHSGLLIYTSVAVLIISRTFLAIRENFVGFFGFFEMAFSVRIVRIAVGVMLHRQLAICFFDVFVRGIAINTKNFVIVFFGHNLLNNNEQKVNGKVIGKKREGCPSRLNHHLSLIS